MTLSAQPSEKTNQEDTHLPSQAGPRPRPAAAPEVETPPTHDVPEEPSDGASEVAGDSAPRQTEDADAQNPVPSGGAVALEALSTSGKWLVGIGIVLWLGIFLGGTTIDSAPFRKAMSPEGLTASIGEEAAEVTAYDGPLIKAVLAAFLFYTPTNLALLTLLAGLLGTLGRKASLYPNAEAAQDADPFNPKLSAFLRSFLVYLVFVSGLLVFADAPFSSPSPASYLRLAGLMSLMSFVANYHPRFFASLLKRASGYLESNGKS